MLIGCLSINQIVQFKSLMQCRNHYLFICMVLPLLFLQSHSENRRLQFSSFVPAYLIQTPETSQYGSFPFRNPLDPYIDIIEQANRPQQDQFSHQSAQFQQIFSGENQKMGSQRLFPSTDLAFGSTQGQILHGGPNQFSSNECRFPRVIIGGICRCPNDQIYLSGQCFSRNNGDQEPDTNIRPYCEPPRKIIFGKCQCPNDQIFLSGQCYDRSRPVFPVDPIGPISNFYGKQPLKKIFRDYNGQNNNQNNRRWGSQHVPLQRRTAPNFKDGIGAPFTHLPNPRYISNEYIAMNHLPERSRYQITMAFVIWGQFLDHDIDLTEAGKSEQMDIEIPYGDRFFYNQEKMEFHRSKYIQKGNGPRQFPNEITAWIDGSQVYGSEEATTRYLRSFKNGKMRTSGGSENLLPRVDNNEDPHNLFYAGDVRSNENIVLTSYHTIFVREHNRLCDQILRQNPRMNDQQVFQTARNYVIALIQKISIEDFLPILLGIEYETHIGPYHRYKPYINPNIPAQFSTAAYRIGHSLIMDTFHLVDKYGYNYKDMKLTEMFFHPHLIDSETIDDIFRGLGINLMKEKGPSMIDELRNLLVLDPENRQVKLDLFSLNIQRSRDHGLPSYNEAREAYGLRKHQSFNEIVRDQQKAEILRNVYRGYIDDVELFVGILSEEPVLGGVLGELGCQIVGQTFRNLRDGDRLWYQNSFPDHLIRQIKQTSFSDIIKRNTQIRDLPQDIFYA